VPNALKADAPVKVALSLNGQQFVEALGASDFSLGLPATCDAIHEDFDFVNNLANFSAAQKRDAWGAFGMHHSYWAALSGGRTEAHCHGPQGPQTLHRYQRLVFNQGLVKRGHGNRMLESVELDNSMGHDASLTFNLTFLSKNDNCAEATALPHDTSETCSTQHWLQRRFWAAEQR
jgi:hypothetical protein